jgi:membrane protein
MTSRQRRKRAITPKVLWRLLQETVAEWQRDKASRLAAALSYYAIFSLAPLIIVIIAIAGSLFGEAAARGRIIDQIQGAVGREGAAFIQTLLQNVSNSGSGTSITASAIGIVVLLFGATGLFVELQDALNTIWGVAAKPNLGVKDFIRKRALSFAMILSISFLLLLSLIISAVLSALSHFAATTVSGLGLFWQIVNLAVSFGVITLLFATIYKILPDVKITWSDVWVGAAITALLFAIGRYLLGLYLSNTAFSSTYGAAGSLIILLVWLYYSAQILFFGAEFTQVYASQYGSQIVPNRYAVPLNNSRQDDPSQSKATDTQ